MLPLRVPTPPMFHKFADFPPEIRRAIWKQAVEDVEPRIIYLDQRRLNYSTASFSRVRSDGKPPTSPLIVPIRMKAIEMDVEEEFYLAKHTRRRNITLHEWMDENPGLFTRLEDRIIYNDEEGIEDYDEVRGPGVTGMDEDENNMEDDHAAFYTMKYLLDERVKVEYQDYTDIGPIHLKGFQRTCSIPSLLLVCKESFDIASKVYCHAFSSLGCPAEQYFDFDRDFLYLNSESFLGDKPYSEELDSLPRNDVHRLRNIAITPPIALFEFPEFYRWISEILGFFGHIKQVIMVTEPSIPPIQFLPPRSYLDLRFREHREKLSPNEYRPDAHLVRYRNLFPEENNFSRRRLERERIRWNRIINRFNKATGRDFSSWEMPLFDYKIILTSQMDTNLRIDDSNGLLESDYDGSSGWETDDGMSSELLGAETDGSDELDGFDEYEEDQEDEENPDESG